MTLAPKIIFAVKRFDFLTHLDGFRDARLGRSAALGIGLDLADRTVLEAEVLIWRIVRQKSAILVRQSLDPGKGHVFI
jgi:hypothetical protein